MAEIKGVPCVRHKTGLVAFLPRDSNYFWGVGVINFSVCQDQTKCQLLFRLFPFMQIENLTAFLGHQYVCGGVSVWGFSRGLLEGFQSAIPFA